MALNIFISWSGERSRLVGETLRDYIPLFLHQVRPWMSNKDIVKGGVWSQEIGQKLEECDIGIFCVTPENQLAPWLNFEAGAVSKKFGVGRVIVLLLGINHEDLDGPLSQFQSTIIEKDDIRKLISTINQFDEANSIDERILIRSFDAHWNSFSDEIHRISRVQIDGSRMNIENVVATFGRYGLPEPLIGNHVYFSNGFESHSLYNSAIEIAESRLWVWGRKNRKLFDKEHRDFFVDLAERMEKGFDFRVLFLNPKSDRQIIDRAHQDQDFKADLEACIDAAVRRLSGVGIEPAKVIKVYTGIRHTGLVFVDDAVLYSPIAFDAHGVALPLTKSPFSVVGSESELGRQLEASFVECWRSAERPPN